MTMDSTSATTFVASLALQEIDYFVMLVVTAFVGWRISEMVRLHFKKLSKTKGGKLSDKKMSEVDEPPTQPRYKTGSEQMSPKPSWRIPPTQTPACQYTVTETTIPKGLLPPPGLAPSMNLRPQWAQMGGTPKITKMPQGTRGSAPIVSSSATRGLAPVREDNAERHLGRVVAWKETGYGFLVDEAGERLFVRQGEVEGDEQLRAGQLVWFRRGRPQGNQAVKALNVQIVNQEAAKAMRQTGATHAAMAPKAQNKALAHAPKHDIVPPAAAKPDMVPPKKNDDNKGIDDDLCAFLGSGSKEEQIMNLKYAPQWVVDKFWSQQSQQPEQK